MAEVINKNPSTTSNDQKKRTSKGKQSIEIKRIESKNARQVTFSKRRKGLFKKIHELCTSYSTFDAQVGIITISQAGKLHSFGYPNEVVIRRYINSLNQNNNDYCGGFLWDKSIDNLGLVEIERFKDILEGLRNEVITRIDEISRCSMSNADGNFDFSGNDGRLGDQVCDFECMKKESNTTLEVIRPELLAPDAFLNLISIKGFI